MNTSVRWGVIFMIKKDAHAVIRAFSKQYKHAKKKEKSVLLNRMVLTTGYSRKHLMEILPDPPKMRTRKKRMQESRYAQILKPLKILWATSNYACGKTFYHFISQFDIFDFLWYKVFVGRESFYSP